MGWKKVKSRISQGGGAPGLVSQLLSGGGNYAYGQFSGTNQQYETAEKNYKLQKEQQAYDRWLQQQIFNREDTAVQRRSADLAAAGINPIMAAGSAANSGAVVSSKAPQLENLKGPDLIAAAGQVMALMQGYNSLKAVSADIARTNAQTELTQAQKFNELEKTPKIWADINKTNAEYDSLKYELGISKRAGVSTKPGFVGSGYRDIKSILTEAKDRVDKYIYENFLKPYQQKPKGQEWRNGNKK